MQGDAPPNCSLEYIPWRKKTAADAVFSIGCRCSFLRLQDAGSNRFVAIGQFKRPVCAQLPANLSGPLLSRTGKVQQDNAQTQIAVNFGVVFVGTANQYDLSGVEDKAVGLAV